LNKLAITSAHQNKRLGRKLLCATVDRFADFCGEMLYLESHSSLTAAIALCESAGFGQEPPPAPAEYDRADAYTVLAPE
jgi:ribosomal protein S18 acetylase RimI-like enzyme